MIRFAILTFLLVGCGKEAPAAPPPPKTATKPAAASVEKPKGDKPRVPRPKSEKQKTAPHKATAKRVVFTDQIEWVEWEAAREASAKTGKPICLVVFAHWCPRCRELAPAFADPEVIELSKKLVMVHQDQDQRPEWLSAYVALGTYVPRVFFFDQAGQVREDVTSGHPRYPHFYTPRSLGALKEAMRKAAAGS